MPLEFCNTVLCFVTTCRTVELPGSQKYISVTYLAHLIQYQSVQCAFVVLTLFSVTLSFIARL